MNKTNNFLYCIKDNNSYIQTNICAIVVQLMKIERHSQTLWRLRTHIIYKILICLRYNFAKYILNWTVENKQTSVAKRMKGRVNQILVDTFRIKLKSGDLGFKLVDVT